MVEITIGTPTRIERRDGPRRFIWVAGESGTDIFGFQRPYIPYNVRSLREESVKVLDEFIISAKAKMQEIAQCLGVWYRISDEGNRRSSYENYVINPELELRDRLYLAFLPYFQISPDNPLKNAALLAASTPMMSGHRYSPLNIDFLNEINIELGAREVNFKGGFPLLGVSEVSLTIAPEESGRASIKLETHPIPIQHD